MRRLISIVLLALSLAACTPAEHEGGTPIPGAQSGAPLNDEAAGPGEQSEIDD